MNPITTVTPRLVNQIRYDQFQQFLGNGAEVNNYFRGKALELFPTTTTNEILIDIPAFEQRTNVKPATGLDRQRAYDRHRDRQQLDLAIPYCPLFLVGIRL